MAKDGCWMTNRIRVEENYVICAKSKCVIKNSLGWLLMRKLLTAVACAAIFIVPLSSLAHSSMIFSGDDFIKLYKSDSMQASHGRAFAYGFVNGAYSQLLASIHMQVSTQYFDCWDHIYHINEMSLQQVVDIFNQYLGRHSHEADKPAIDLFDTAILNRFPVNAHAVHECVKNPH